MNIAQNLRRLLVRSIALFVSCTSIGFLYLILPFKKIKVGFLVAERIGHLALNVDLFARRQQLNQVEDCLHIFLSKTPCNQKLLNMWKRNHFIIQNEVIFKVFNLYKGVWEKTPFLEPLPMESNEYEIYQNTEATLEFTEEEQRQGQSLLRELGIDPEKDWYVCVFARDSAYLNSVASQDWSYHEYRNADIDNFIPAIEHILSLGGAVLRIGRHVQKELKINHPKFVDYATHYRNEFADIFLVAHCKFLLGTTSGICDLAMVFDVPRLGTNIVPIGHMPWGKKNLYIPKLMTRRQTDEIVPFREILNLTKERNNPLMFDGNLIESAGYKYLENTPEDILEVTKEKVSRLNNNWKPNEEERHLLEQYYQTIPEDHWSSEVLTPIGLHFLKKYPDVLK